MIYEILKISDSVDEGDPGFEVVDELEDYTKANLKAQELMKENRGELYIVRPQKGS